MEDNRQWFDAPCPIPVNSKPNTKWSMLLTCECCDDSFWAVLDSGKDYSCPTCKTER